MLTILWLRNPGRAQLGDSCLETLKPAVGWGWIICEELYWAAIQDGSLVWLAVDAGCQLGAQLGRLTRVPGHGLPSMAVLGEFNVLHGGWLPPE